MTSLADGRARAPTLLETLGDEGVRLFFPLSALHAALWPFLWVAIDGLDMPLESSLSPGVWHGYEMIFGAYGGALVGFITSAVPEWTDTERPRGRILFPLAAAWGIGRVSGLLGSGALVWPASLADLLWLWALPAYVAGVTWRRRTDRLLGFLVWLSAFAIVGTAVRYAFLTGDELLAREALRLSGLVFLGILSLALGRITVPVTNLVLDPSEETSPFRPHPGRLNLAAGLVALVIAGEIADLSTAVTGYLYIAAGAAFLDRVAEGFVGRETLRAEILGLAGSSLLAGAGLLGIGLSRLGAPLPEPPALHLSLMGGLGLAVVAVFSIAGLLHTGRTLPLPGPAKFAFALIVVGTLLRALPELGLMPFPPGPPYVAASLLWATGFLVWLKAYWPILADRGSLGGHSC